jgi:hypothetical protein
MKRKDKIYWYCVGALWLAVLLNSCKSTKPGCDSYGNYLKIDTLYLEGIHKHIETDSTYKCIYFPEETVTITWWAFTDTTKTK